MRPFVEREKWGPTCRPGYERVRIYEELAGGLTALPAAARVTDI